MPCIHLVIITSNDDIQPILKVQSFRINSLADYIFSETLLNHGYIATQITEYIHSMDLYSPT